VADALEDGWQPTTPPDDTLVRSFVTAIADRFAWIAERVTGRVERRDDAVIADAGSPVVFDNGVVVLGSPSAVDLDALVTDARAFFDPDRPWVLLSALPTPDLTPLGLELMGHPPVMARLPGPTPAGGDGDRGLDIVEVGDAAALAEWNDTFAAAYPMPSVPPFDEHLLGGPLRFWLGREGGRPVAASAAWLTDRLTDVEYVATLPEVRGKGYGAAITWPATTVQPDRPAVLIASDPGRPVYERMGYVSLLRFTLWQHD
jgi:GNAT superfamily N-acetyltransferase